MNEKIAIAEFEEMIASTAQKIEKSIFDCLAAAAVNVTDIKRGILTGGTSQVPLLNRLVVKIFGEERIPRPDYFSSVATGLDYVASRLNIRVPVTF